MFVKVINNNSHPFLPLYDCVIYLVDSRKTQAEVLAGSLNWLISLSLSEAVVLPSSPARHHKTNGSNKTTNKVSIHFSLDTAQIILQIPMKYTNTSCEFLSVLVENHTLKSGCYQESPAGGSTHWKSMRGEEPLHNQTTVVRNTLNL